MKYFTIEHETNNITCHATKEEAAAVESPARFSSEKQLAAIVKAKSPAQVLEIWNSLPGVVPVNKFKDRTTAAARIWKAIQSLGDAGVNTLLDEPADVAAELAPEAETAAPAKAKARRAKKEPTAAGEGKAPREGSKTSRVIEMLKREGGATLEEIMTEMGWQQHTTRALMSAGGSLTKKHGITVVSTKNEAGERSYSIQA